MSVKVNFIIPTYDRIAPLQCLIGSLLSQTDDDWEANIMFDRPYEGFDMIYIDMVMGHLDFVRDGRVRYTFMDKRYNDFGHTLREKGKQETTSEYIIMTGDDNYYTPNLVKELREATKEAPGMVYWDMIHSHFGYQYFKCVPRTHQIDMGAFATRTDLAKQIKLGTNFAADGDFVEDFNRKFPLEKKIKINKVLFVHN